MIKKTRIPVLICIICAIICVIATLLVLFVVPSKYNLISHNTNDEVEPDTIIEEVIPVPAEEPEPEIEEEEPVIESEVVAPSVDNEVVAAPAEEIVPELPPAPKAKPVSTTYKIKWGDTLWDIADSYYRNPWRYHRIARYNNIKDPDYIISGTTIEIPAE